MDWGKNMCAIWWEKIFETIYSTLFVFPFLLTVFVLRVLLSSYVYLFILFEFVVPYVYLLYYVCIAVLALDAGLLTRSQYLEGPATESIPGPPD